MPEGSLLTVVYELEGYQFMALNGGDLFPDSRNFIYSFHARR